MDFPLSQCQTILATHADVDHIQGLSQAKQMLRTTVTAHPVAADALRRGDRLFSFAEIPAQNIDMELPPVEVEREINEGDRLRVGGLELEVWLTPGHTNCQLCFRLGDLLFSGDNLYRDGCVPFATRFPTLSARSGVRYLKTVNRKPRMFTTSRSDIDITARAVSDPLLGRLIRLLVIVAGFVVLLVLLRVLPRDAQVLHGSRWFAGAMLLVGLLSLLLGIFPILALVALIYGLVHLIRLEIARRREHSAPRPTVAS